MLKKISFSIVFTIFINSSLAQAAGYVRIATMYMSNSSGVEGSTTNTSRTMIDLGAGKLYANGFTLGGMYGSEKYDNGTSTSNRTGIGPTIGYMKNKAAGFFVLGTYFINPTMTGGYKGNGYQIDIGYRFALDTISIAPQFSKKSFTYDEQNGQSISPAYVEDRIDPYFVVWIPF